VQLYRQAADLGNTNAMTILGGMYANGRGVAKDDSEAVRLYQQAADLGNASATYKLGWRYENGVGVTKDIAKARSYYQTALGAMYANGKGVAKDDAEAMRLFRQAADLGNTNAMISLGTMIKTAGASPRTRPKPCGSIARRRT
jgi:uncharacterized protein